MLELLITGLSLMLDAAPPQTPPTLDAAEVELFQAEPSNDEPTEYRRRQWQQVKEKAIQDLE